MGLTTFDETAAEVWSWLLVPASGTGFIALVPTDVFDRRVDSILVSNRDGIAHVINLSLIVGSSRTQLGSVSVPAGAGYAGTPSVDILPTSLPATQVGLVVPGNYALNFNVSVAVVATFDMSVTAFGGRVQ